MSSKIAEDIPPQWSAGVVFLLVGTIAGFFLGRLTAPTVIAAKIKGHSKEEKAEEVELESDSEDDGEVKDFGPSNEEYKLILVVRTDLGMTKGSTPLTKASQIQKLTRNKRQDSSTVWSCYVGMLQDITSLWQTSYITTLGITWPSKGVGASKERRPTSYSTSPSYVSRSCCESDSRCWSYADCEW
jgi:hypothetical protein